MNLTFRRLALTLPCVLAAQACLVAEEDPDAEQLAGQTQAVVYGTDQRTESTQHASETLRSLAHHAVMLVSRGAVTKGADGYLQFDPNTLGSSMNLCAGERFASQPIPGYCTGFLIGKDRVVSAGHCFGAWEQTLAQTNNVCNYVDVVLDYDVAYDGTLPHVLNDRLFGCKRVLSRSMLEGDSVQFELDRETTRAGFELDPVLPLTTGQALVAIGHPDGLPKKTTSGMRLRNPSEMPGTAGAGLFTFEGDLFHGNSGSPILDAETLRVVGIHAYGWEEDYVDDAALGCKRVHQLPDGTGNPAGAVRIAAPLLDQTLTGTLAHSSGRVLRLDADGAGAGVHLTAMQGDAYESFYYHPSSTLVVSGGWATNVLTSTGSSVLAQPPNGSTSQRWTLSDTQILAFGGKCLQSISLFFVPSRMELRQCVAGSSAQRFSFGADGTLRNSSGRCLQPRAGSSSAGTSIEAATCNGSLAQRWLAARYGFFVAFNGAEPRMCLDVKDGRPLDGSTLQIAPCRYADDAQIAAQQFHLRGPVRNGSGQCLEGEADSVSLKSCTGSLAQRWDYYP